MNILITGCAGFIGFHLCNKILQNKKLNIFGIDNLNDYYDVKLKKDRLKILNNNKKFKFFKIDINNKEKIIKNFKQNKYDVVINLAAQAGVRHSISNPQAYFDSNLTGFFNIIDASRTFEIKHFIYASTSSVYGESKDFPLKENIGTSKPMSFYAATKKCNEIIAYSYSNIYNMHCTALRFFTVYGPFGRPDMALFSFCNSILKNKSLNLFNKGKHIRDFTHVYLVTEYLKNIITKPSKEKIPHSIFNIGSDEPKSLKFFLKTIEDRLNKKAKVKLLKKQKGDVYKTHADISKISKLIKTDIRLNLKEGIDGFVTWYKDYYNI